MEEMYNRTVGLIGEEALSRLKNSAVAVAGLGGVGGYAVEMLARSGVGKLYIFDSDRYSESNLNRQIGATADTVGRLKTEATAERIRAINPEAAVVLCDEFITPESNFPFGKVDYIIDAVDNVTAKLFLAKGAQENRRPIISVMGTGNKLCPERLRISDISKTFECPLCRVMRYECKKRGIISLDCVWSDEKPIRSGFSEKGKSVPASMGFVPAAAGIMAASFVVRRLIKK